MLGKKAEVSKRMQDKFTKTFVWHCVAHHLELCAHDV